MLKYDGEDFYTYQGTNILRNLANVRTQRELDEFEADATLIQQVKLVSNPIPRSYDLLHLQAIHQYLFLDVYDWAG